MLQTVPDPFDSYGPPQAEDQIFTILPPLSVIANVPSSAPSPLTSSTAELESNDGLSSGKNSWTNSSGFFPDAVAAWADVPSSSSPPTNSAPGSGATSPARSISPTTGLKPASPTSGLSRRHSHPVAAFGHQSRKSESKLRSVLSVLDEGGVSLARPQNGTADAEGGHARTMSADPGAGAGAGVSSGYGKAPDLGGAGSSVWGGVRYLDISNPSRDSDDSEEEEAGESTPRNTLRAKTQAPPLPSFEDPPFSERSRSPHSDDTAMPSPVAS